MRHSLIRAFMVTAAMGGTIMLPASMALAKDPVAIIASVLPEDVSREIDAQWGKLIIEQFSSVLSDSANGDCVRSNKLRATNFREAARKILMESALRTRSYLELILLSEGYRIEFEKAFGTSSLAEWEAMLQDNTMRERFNLTVPERKRFLIDRTVYWINKGAYAQAGGPLKKVFGAAETGDATLAAARDRLVGDMTARIGVFDKVNPSPLLKRFEAMEDWWLILDLARNSEPKESTWPKMWAKDILPNLLNDLRRICVF